MAREMREIGSPLSVQERLKDMQSLLIMKSIRAAHDSDPTVLGAIDHAISVIQSRIDKRTEQDAGDFRLNFLRQIVPLLESGKASISNFGVDREVDSFDVTSLSDASVRQMTGRRWLTYKIEIVSQEVGLKGLF